MYFPRGNFRGAWSNNPVCQSETAEANVMKFGDSMQSAANGIILRWVLYDVSISKPIQRKSLKKFTMVNLNED